MENLVREARRKLLELSFIQFLQAQIKRRKLQILKCLTSYHFAPLVVGVWGQYSFTHLLILFICTVSILPSQLSLPQNYTKTNSLQHQIFHSLSRKIKRFFFLSKQLRYNLVKNFPQFFAQPNIFECEYYRILIKCA